MSAPRHSIVAALGLACPLAASAHNWSYGYAWANSPSASSYTPDASYSYSDVGTPPQIERSETGKYSVSFPGLGAINPLEANVQVTAYGTSSNYCKAQAWSGDTITVTCFDTAGNPVDTMYTVLYLEADLADHAAVTPPNVGGYAFALADQSANPSYTPDPDYASNPGGGAITATRSATGSYSITWAGMSAIGSGGGHVQVTAVGVGNARCRVHAWSSETAQVRCYNAAGAPTDSAYSSLYWRPDVADPGLAFAYADQPASASYTPSAYWSYNDGGGAVSAARTSTGVYGMNWSGMNEIGINSGHVQVTAYGGSDVRCKVALWSSSGAAVLCFDAAGNPVDSSYTVLFLKMPKKPWAREYAFVAAPGTPTMPHHPFYIASFNAVGGYDYDESPTAPRMDIQTDRSSPGVYSVNFDGFRAYPGGGNVQVRAFGGGNGYCKVAFWGSEDVAVRCFDAAGAASDSPFHVFYLKAPAQNTSVAYAWAQNAALASYTPDPSYSHNPAGGAISATRAGTGLYTMTWSGFGALTPGGGHPQVTAYGVDNRRCQIQGWSGDSVSVRCFDNAGNLADSRYSILYLRPGDDDDGLAFAWANDVAPPYTPNTLYSFNAGNPVRAGYDYGPGKQGIFFDYLDGAVSAQSVLVTGYGNTDNRLLYSTTEVDLDVSTCHDAAGNPVDALFNTVDMRPVAVPEPGHVALLASGTALLSLLARRRGVR